MNMERPEITNEVPNGGANIQDEKLYWNFPDGTCDCYSMRQLSHATPDELAGNNAEAYPFVAGKFGYDPLGEVDDENPDAVLAEYRENRGTVQDKLWQKIKWRMSAKQSDVCWWLTHASTNDTS